MISRQVYDYDWPMQAGKVFIETRRFLWWRWVRYRWVSYHYPNNETIAFDKRLEGYSHTLEQAIAAAKMGIYRGKTQPQQET